MSDRSCPKILILCLVNVSCLVNSASLTCFAECSISGEAHWNLCGCLLSSSGNCLCLIFTLILKNEAAFVHFYKCWVWSGRSLPNQSCTGQLLQRSLYKWFKKRVLSSHKIVQSSEYERQSSAVPQHYFLTAQEMMIPIPVFSMQPMLLAAEKHSYNISASEWFFPPALLVKSLVQRQEKCFGVLSREHVDVVAPAA